jgi:hypothetical protein
MPNGTAQGLITQILQYHALYARPGIPAQVVLIPLVLREHFLLEPGTALARSALWVLIILELQILLVLPVQPEPIPQLAQHLPTMILQPIAVFPAAIPDMPMESGQA